VAAIDLDRGVTQRKHGGGFFVSMYKDDPGLYYLEDGTTCDTKIAAEAGFPVTEHYKERRRRQLMGMHKKRLDDLMKKSIEEVDAEVERELADMKKSEEEALLVGVETEAG